MTYILPYPENAAGWWLARIGSGPVVSLEWSLVGVLSLESDSFTEVQDHSCPLIRQDSFSFRQPHVHLLVLVCLCLEFALHNVKPSNLALFCLAVHLDFPMRESLATLQQRRIDSKLPSFFLKILMKFLMQGLDYLHTKYHILHVRPRDPLL